MQINNRNEDLMKVFDRTWKANHNNDVKEAREKEKKFIDKLFNVQSNITPSNKQISNEEKLDTMNKNIESLRKYDNKRKVSDIRSKFN